MKNWTLYRMLLHALPARGGVRASSFPPEETEKAAGILRKHRCVGAALCLFDETGVRGTLIFGSAHLPDQPVREDTVFRAASVSKFATGLCAMKMAEQGRLDLDRDVNDYLPVSLRHPRAPHTPVTMRMLMTHTAGIHDGAAYNTGIARGAPLSELLRGDSFTGHLPGTLWEYSNFGAGIAGAVMEAAAGKDFEALMQETLFRPLGVEATFYPQLVRGDLADAVRILPPGAAPAFDAGKRRALPLPPAGVNAEKHYALAHGNLYISAPQLAALGLAGMKPGFLSARSLEDMRRAAVPFGARARNLSQGLFTFVLREPSVCPRVLYGHQGMAYGAVHGLFFDPAAGRGTALLTVGASEARRGVLADLNADMLRLFLGDGHG